MREQKRNKLKLFSFDHFIYSALLSVSTCSMCLYIMYFCPFLFIEKQATIIEIMKKRIKENMATAWDGPLLRLLHVIKMLRTKSEKLFCWYVQPFTS